MSSSPARFLGLTLALLAGPASSLSAQVPPSLPAPVTNNAVAAGRIGGEWRVFSFLGVDSTKRWSGIVRAAASWRPGQSGWEALPPVPGPAGRLAATAQVVRRRAYVFGGYSVDSAGKERSVPSVDIYDPVRKQWRAGAPIPIAVDDAVSLVWRDSLVYLVSGWHDTDNVQQVQIYDVVKNRWSRATPIPGPGVFGHTGGGAGNTIVFIDGAARQPSGPKYRLVPQTWVGTIDPAHPASIAWRASAAPHPGPLRYRAAAASCGPFVLFAGGTANPYNYNGVGYDGVPSEPMTSVMAFDTRSGRWRNLLPAPTGTMDHRALAVRGDTAWIVGGMRSGRQVSAAVERWTLGACQGDDARLVEDPADSEPRPEMVEVMVPLSGVASTATFYSAAGTGPHPTVIFLHAVPGFEKNFDLLQALRRIGYHILYFDYRGNWGTGGTFTFAGAIQDASSAIDYLTSGEPTRRLRIDPDRVVLMGHSFGAVAAVAAGARDSRVRCIVSLAPEDLTIGINDTAAAGRLVRYMDGVRVLAGATGALTVAEMRAHEREWAMTSLMASIGPKPYLLIGGALDRGFDAAEVERARAAAEAGGARNASFLSLDQADHSFSARRIELTRLVAGWLGQRCPPTGR